LLSLQYMQHYIKIGKFVASHGIHGHLLLAHNLGKKTLLKNIQALFIEEKKDLFLPYFIEKVSVKNSDELLVKLEGIETLETARKLTPRPVWLTQNDFKKVAAKEAPISLLGFMLVDGKTELGEIIEVIEQPHQLLCAIQYKGKEALIPVHEDNLVKLDQQKRKVIVNIPEGLLEIYT